VNSIAIVTEDRLTEAVCERLAADLGIEVHMKLRKDGCGYLKSKLDSFMQMSLHYPVLVVTDLDEKTCAPSLLRSWLNGRVLPPEMMLRVAVREVEAWLMADHEAFGDFIGARINFDVESLADPKARLLSLARNANRNVREELVAARGAVASQGVGYNIRLGNFVANSWSPERAAANSDSLFRTIRKLRQLLL